jgi:hypothetical protein
VGEFVEREVIYNVSYLVHQIGKLKPDEWTHLLIQDDWQTPATDAIRAMTREELAQALNDAGLAIGADDSDDTLRYRLRENLRETDALRDFCEDRRLDPQQTEIYEHRIVTRYLADKLEAKGEVIEHDFYGLTIWGRAATGQAILLDAAICDIFDELHPEWKTRRIAELNDLCRTAPGIAGKLVQTPGIRALPTEDQSAIREKVERFADFNPGNDPHGERDFGSFEHNGKKVFWKIDYYAPGMESGSDDPSDPARTVRVLTIMLASEY